MKTLILALIMIPSLSSAEVIATGEPNLATQEFAPAVTTTKIATLGVYSQAGWNVDEDGTVPVATRCEVFRQHDEIHIQLFDRQGRSMSHQWVTMPKQNLGPSFPSDTTTDRYAQRTTREYKNGIYTETTKHLNLNISSVIELKMDSKGERVSRVRYRNYNGSPYLWNLGLAVTCK